MLFSIGESIYSPRTYDYAMRVSPAAQEGLYSSLMSSPIFISKMIAGPFGGLLLDSYCSGIAEGTSNSLVARMLQAGSAACRRPGMVWIWIGIVSISAPIIMLVFQRYLRSKDRTGEPSVLAEPEQELPHGINLESSSATIEMEELSSDALPTATAR